jgi:hypothetical protein
MNPGFFGRPARNCGQPRPDIGTLLARPAPPETRAPPKPSRRILTGPRAKSEYIPHIGQLCAQRRTAQPRVGPATRDTATIANGPDSHVSQDKIAEAAARICGSTLTVIPVGRQVPGPAPGRVRRRGARLPSGLSQRRPEPAPRARPRSGDGPPRYALTSTDRHIGYVAGTGGDNRADIAVRPHVTKIETALAFRGCHY